MMPVRALAARPAPGVAASRRTFWTRLLLPRFRDVVFKWAFLPTGALVAVSVGGHSLTGRDVVQLLLLWVVVEQLAYQARYLVNDLRDRVTDAQHPADAQKSRLAFPMTPARLVGTWASVAARLVLALLISVLVLDGTFGEAALGFIVLLLPVSALYEAARDRIRREDAEPASLRARTLALPVLLSVPLGYGLRVWAGYHALKPPADPWWHVGLLVVTALLLQLATVMLGWAWRPPPTCAASRRATTRGCAGARTSRCSHGTPASSGAPGTAARGTSTPARSWWDGTVPPPARRTCAPGTSPPPPRSCSRT